MTAQRGGKVVLVVEDDADNRDTLREFLEASFSNVRVVTAERPSEALGMLQDLRPAVALADLVLPGMDGVAFLRELRRRHPSTRRILVTGHPDVFRLTRAVNEAGVQGILLKPLEPKSLMTELKKGLEGVAGDYGRIPPVR